MSLETILQLVISSTLVYSAPLIFTALGGTFSERAGVVNVGLEGTMIMGAFAGVVFNLTFAGQFGGLTPWLGLLAGAVIGLIFSLLHAHRVRYSYELDGASFGCLLDQVDVR